MASKANYSKIQERLKKERQVFEIFEEIFFEKKNPITCKEFIETAASRLQGIYSITMINSVLSRMEKDKKIQKVYLKEGRSQAHLYAPLHFEIPYHERRWETDKERKERKIAFFQKINGITEEDVFFYLQMIASSEIKNSYPGRIMPIFRAIEQRDANYTRLIRILNPFLELLEERERYVLTQRLGIQLDEPRTFAEIGDSIGVGPAQCNEVFRYALYNLKRLMIEKITIEQM